MEEDYDDDAKRGREDETPDKPVEGFPQFFRLPPDIQVNILINMNMSIVEMHRRCNKVHSKFRELCENRFVWKRVFINRLVKKPGDKRNPAKFEQWADEPQVQIWDRDSIYYPNLAGFTHLIAEVICTTADSSPTSLILRRHAETWRIDLRPAVFSAGSVKYITLDFNGPDLLGLMEYSIKMFVLFDVQGVQERGRLLLHLPPGKRIPIIAYLLEHGWASESTSGHVKYLNCVLCAAPATMQCVHCNDVYCSTECLKK